MSLSNCEKVHRYCVSKSPDDLGDELIDIAIDKRKALLALLNIGPIEARNIYDLKLWQINDIAACALDLIRAVDAELAERFDNDPDLQEQLVEEMSKDYRESL